MRADGQTDWRDEAFHTFANALKNGEIWVYLRDLLVTENVPYIHA